MNCVCCDTELSLYSKRSHLGLPVYVCNSCKTYQTGESQTITKEKTEELYKKAYWDERTSENSLNSDYTDTDSQGKKRRWLSQYKYVWRFFPKEKKLLEIGAGAGQSLFWFESNGFDVTGIEPDNRNVEMINQKLKSGKCFEGYAEKFDLQGSFDIIWISHVFEHVIEPEKVLRRLRLLLEKDGILFIEVPNCENEKTLHDSVYDNPSTYHFSKKGLLTLAQKTGYKVLCCDYFRSPTQREGAINRVMRNFPSLNPYKFYPKILCDSQGTDIRLVLKVNYTKD